MKIKAMTYSFVYYKKGMRERPFSHDMMIFIEMNSVFRFNI